LILAGGDSAKTSVLAGLSIIGRDKYGVYSVGGKMPNARDSQNKNNSHKKSM
jgi:DNA topoisomerase II